MEADRSPEVLSDTALDREIEAALAVDPSPEFTVRVRSRIASEGAPSAWRFPSTLVVMGALAATIVAAAVVFRPREVVNPGPSRPAVVESRPLAVAPLALAPGLVGLGRVASAKSQRSNAPKSEAVVAEVLIAADEAAALRHFLTGVRDGLVDLSTLAESQDAAQFQPPQEIVIAPIGDFGSIAIEPIVPVAQQEGVR